MIRYMIHSHKFFVRNSFVMKMGFEDLIHYYLGYIPAYIRFMKYCYKDYVDGYRV